MNYRYSISAFIQAYSLQAGDVLVARKNQGIFQHFVVYLGHNGLHPVFVANMRGTGVRYIPENELAKLANEYPVKKIRRFVGSAFARAQAVQRAVRAMSLQAYHLLTSNCEHFANYVQTGKQYSSQSHNAALGMATAGATMALASDNSAVQFGGIVLLLLGGVVAIREEENANR